MRRPVSVALLASLLALLATALACPPDDRTDTGTLDAGSEDAGAVDAGAVDAGGVDAGLVDAGRRDAGAGGGPRDECVADGDCSGGVCRALPERPGATRFCVGERPLSRRSCAPDAGPGDWPGACCASDECATDAGPGFCVDFQVGYCGGAAPPEVNTCRYDACAGDADCGPGRACVPAGAFGRVTSVCVEAPCAADGDCAARAGGECRPLLSGACGSIGGFYCSYEDDPCRLDADCPPSDAGYPQTCQPRGDRNGTMCVPSLPAP